MYERQFKGTHFKYFNAADKIICLLELIKGLKTPFMIGKAGKETFLSGNKRAILEELKYVLCIKVHALLWKVPTN